MTATLQDLVYFGSFWQILQETASTPPIVLGGGYANAQVFRDAEGLLFGGVVEKRDASGRVTDVILTFAGATGLDAVQGEAILLGLPLDEAARATAMYDGIIDNPAYAGAKVHVTGHSLGAGYAQFVLAHALATDGAEVTDDRAEFVTFGSPNWGAAAARHFGLDPALLDSRYATYVSENDPVLINGLETIGTMYFLPAFDGLGLLNPLNLLASHWPTTYASALGLPDWLSASDAAAAYAYIDGQFQPGLSTATDPNYGAPGQVGMRIEGSSEDDIIHGLDGADRIQGGLGADELWGGGGNDIFDFNSRAETHGDVIMDFQSGDRIDLRGIDARTDRLFDQAFTVIGEQAFTGAGQLRVWQANGSTWVAGNVNADGTPDFLLHLAGLHTLTASDFLL